MNSSENQAGSDLPDTSPGETELESQYEADDDLPQDAEEASQQDAAGDPADGSSADSRGEFPRPQSQPRKPPRQEVQQVSPRRRMQELLAIPDSQRTDPQWDELIELEIQLAPGNRISNAGNNPMDRGMSNKPPVQNRAPRPPRPVPQGQGGGGNSMAGNGGAGAAGGGAGGGGGGAGAPGKRPFKKFRKGPPKPKVPA